VLTESHREVDHRNAELRLLLTVPDLHDETPLVHIESGPDLLYVAHGKSQLLVPEGLDAVSDHQPPEVPPIDDLSSLVDISAHHELISIQILPHFQIDLVVHQNHLLHHYLGKQNVKVILHITLYEDLELHFHCFLASYIIISEADALLVVLEQNLHFGNFGKSERASSIFKLKFCVLDATHCLNLFVVIVNSASEFEFTQPVRLSHIFFLLHQDRWSDLNLILLEETQILTD
jgi:hypothetical protein